jgi:hypothetical protein
MAVFTSGGSLNWVGGCAAEAWPHQHFADIRGTLRSFAGGVSTQGSLHLPLHVHQLRGKDAGRHLQNFVCRGLLHATSRGSRPRGGGGRRAAAAAGPLPG